MFNQLELKIPVDILLRMCYYVHAEFFFIAAERRMFSLRKLIFISRETAAGVRQGKAPILFRSFVLFLPKK